jgi:uncharacterized membrane protein YozB (DUF420 family)
MNNILALKNLAPVKQNLMVYSILLFLILYILVLMVRPNIVFDTAGNLRPFGVGFKKKTILPAWLAAIVLAIISYLILAIYVFD